MYKFQKTKKGMLKTLKILAYRKQKASAISCFTEVLIGLDMAKSQLFLEKKKRKKS